MHALIMLNHICEKGIYTASAINFAGIIQNLDHCGLAQYLYFVTIHKYALFSPVTVYSNAFKCWSDTVVVSSILTITSGALKEGQQRDVPVYSARWL